MSKMKSFMVPMMAIAAVASAVPAAASAQAYRPAPHVAQAQVSYAYAARKDGLERRIDRAVSMRRLDVREGRELKQEMRDINRMERDFARGGFSRQERQRLEQRLSRVEAKFERELRQERREDRRDERRYR